jgi:hypothetical protein
VAAFAAFVFNTATENHEVLLAINISGKGPNLQRWRPRLADKFLVKMICGFLDTASDFLQPQQCEAFANNLTMLADSPYTKPRFSRDSDQGPVKIGEFSRRNRSLYPSP